MKRFITFLFIGLLSYPASACAWIHGTASGVTPVLTATTLSGSTPAVLNTILGSVLSSATLTSCNITAGDSSGNFSCTASGTTVQIKYSANGVTNLTGDKTRTVVTQTLTVTGTNSNGTSAGVSVPVNMYADGSVNAQSGGTKPYVSLNAEGSVNGAVSYSSTPPWKVAGIDYFVGANVAACAGGVYVDPGTQSTGGGLTWNQSAHTVTMTGVNATVQCFDFSLEGGCWRVISSNTGQTIKNNKFSVGSGCSNRLDWINGGAHVLYNTMDGGCTPTDGAAQPYTAANVYNNMISGDDGGEILYNLIKNSCADNINFGASVSSNTPGYNFIENGALVNTIHNNWIQTSGGTNTNIQLIYNNGHNNSTGGNNQNNPGEAWQFDSQQSGTVLNSVAAQNICIAEPVPPAGSNTGQSISYCIDFHAGTSNTGGQALNNYLDTRGAFGPFAIDAASGSFSFSTCSGNKYMTGGAITGTFGAATCN